MVDGRRWTVDGKYILLTVHRLPSTVNRSQMFDYDKWQEIFNTIRTNKLRTFLTALGVFWGIFMLIVLMGAGTGLQNGVFSTFGGLAKNAVFVWSNRTTMPYKGFQPGRRLPLTSDDIRAIESEMGEEIEYMAPRLWVSSGEISYKKNKGAFDVRGDTPDLLKIDAMDIIEGRFLNDRDISERRKIVVIGKRVKDQLFGEEQAAIGEYIKIQGNDFLVVGIAKSLRSGENGEDDEKTIFLPLTTAQQITNQLNRIHWFVCTVNTEYNSSIAENTIKSILKKRHKVHPDDPQAFGSNNLQEEIKEIMGLFNGIKFMVWFVGAGSLLFGIIGVGNIMLIVVKDRTKEIGIRKAMGATPRSIISMILLESVFITTVAGYLGLVVSIGIVYAMKMAAGTELEMFRNPEINMGVGLGALAILVVAGALTGLAVLPICP